MSCIENAINRIDGMSEADLAFGEAARARMAMVIDRARESGHYNCVNHSVDSIFSPGLFYRVSGIGYEM